MGCRCKEKTFWCSLAAQILMSLVTANFITGLSSLFKIQTEITNIKNKNKKKNAVLTHAELCERSL